MQNEPHPADCPGCPLCTGRRSLGPAIAVLKPDSGEINAALLEACSRVLRSIDWSTGSDRMTPGEQTETLRAAIAQATAHTPA